MLESGVQMFVSFIVILYRRSFIAFHEFLLAIEIEAKSHRLREQAEKQHRLALDDYHNKLINYLSSSSMDLPHHPGMYTENCDTSMLNPLFFCSLTDAPVVFLPPADANLSVQ